MQILETVRPRHDLRWRGGPEWVVRGLLVASLGCGHDTTGPTTRDLATLPWRLELNHHAVTLSTYAPYDTVQLSATTRTVNGTPLREGMAVSYTTSNATAVVVSTSGLITARRRVSNNVLVVAAATIAGVTVVDTAVVRVNATVDVPPTFTRLVLQATQNRFAPLTQPVPESGEGLTIDCGSFPVPMRTVQLAVKLFDASGTDMARTSVVEFRSSNPAILAVGTNRGNLTASCSNRSVGPVTITATATVYGVTCSDSVRILVIPSLTATVTVRQRIPRATGQPVNFFDPGTVEIATGGIVFWALLAKNTPKEQPIDVLFDVDNPTVVAQGVDTLAFGVDEDFRQSLRQEFPYPTDAAAGNIPAFVAAETVYPLSEDSPYVVSYRARRFPVPGTYHYHSALYGTTGTIIVRPWNP